MSLIEGRFERKLVATYLLLVVAIVSVAGLYILSSLKRASIDHLKASLQAQARLMSNEVNPVLIAKDFTTLQSVARRLADQVGARVTVIEPGGRVLADSEQTLEHLARMDNHLGRPEVRGALAEGVGSALRRSDTLGVEMLYLAIPLRQDRVITGVLRVAMPLSDVSRSIATIRQTLVIGAALALTAAAALGFLFARHVTRPIVQMTTVARRMAKGDFSRRISAVSGDEIGQLGHALNLMAQRLEDRLAEFEEERAKGAAILDSMVEGVLAVDGDNRVLFINASACRLFNASSVGAAGRPFLEVIRNKEILDLLDRTLREGTFAQQELEIYTPVHRIIQVHAAPLKGRWQTSGAILVLHDVTELRRLEMVRTEFVANVSHELRTPLTSIKGYLETLLEGGLEDREHARPFLEVIHKHAERLGRLLDDLLDLSNLELKKITLHRRPTGLAEVVESVLAIFAPQAAKQEIELRAEVPNDLPPALADRDRVAQVLINLLDNSLKFTSKGGTVIVGAQRVPSSEFGVPSSKAGTWNLEPGTASGSELVEISVSDTGIGIPSQDLPRITERFYRVDKTRSRELGGTGLGLAIVKHLVEAHGGNLVIESQLNRGTTVRITLPIAPPDEDGA
jgi:two-component system phosphate regulon sensor histidine kinase PhoR